MKAKPQPSYARLTQPPRSARHGRNRSPATKNHSDPLDGASAGAGGAGKITIRTGLPPSTWRTINNPVLPFNPGLSASLAYADFKRMVDALIGQTVSVQLGIDLASQPSPIPHSGIRSGELTGHRAWLVTDEGNLCSLAHHFIWEPRETIEGNINVVVFHNSIWGDRYGGVYAYRYFCDLRDDELKDCAANQRVFPYRRQINEDKTLGDTFWFGVGHVEFATYIGVAYGTVKMWGETVEHEKGYRSSFAKPTSIDGFIGISGFDLAALKERYGV